MDDPILEYNILDTVHENEGRVTHRHISRKIGRSVASVNFAVRLLAAKGYIKIQGTNPRKLRYYLTPKGVLQKSVLAYNFLKKQSALYHEVRRNLLGKLKELAAEGVRNVAIYGWTPFTEAAILFLISEGTQVSTIYVENLEPVAQWNRIPIKLIEEFEGNCEALLLMEPMPRQFEDRTNVRKVVCFPEP